MEEELYTLLASGVSFPVAWGPFGESDGLPRASLYRASKITDLTLEGSDQVEARVNIDCYGASFSEAIEVSRDINAILQDYRGGVIQGAFLDNTRDSFTDDASLVHRVMLTFVIHYTE